MLRFLSRGNWGTLQEKENLLWFLATAWGVNSVGVRTFSDALTGQACRTVPLDMDTDHCRSPAHTRALVLSAHSFTPPPQVCLQGLPNPMALPTEILHALVLLPHMFPHSLWMPMCPAMSYSLPDSTCAHEGFPWCLYSLCILTHLAANCDSLALWRISFYLSHEYRPSLTRAQQWTLSSIGLQLHLL